MKKFVSLVLCLLLVFSLVSCAASVNKESSPEWSVSDSSWGGSASEEGTGTSLSSSDLQGRKQIYRYELSLYTSSFDELTQSIRGEVAALGGFVEEVSLDSGRTTRSTTMVVRVPTEDAEAFVAGMEGRAVVMSKSQTTEDVTLEYVDVETRLNNLEAERQALAALMEKADSVEEIISIQARLSEVQYELESYTARKNKIDELVSLSTVTFCIREVEREEAVASGSVWSEISSGFMNNLLGVGEFFVDLFVFLIASLPILVIPVVVILVIVFAVRKSIRKKKKKEQTPPQEKH